MWEQRNVIGAMIFVIATIVMIVSVIYDSRTRRRRFATRTPRMPDRETAFEAAFAAIARLIATDIGIDQRQIQPTDRLDTLGYFNDDEWNDSTEALFDLLSNEFEMKPELFRGCATVGDLVERLSSQRSPLDPPAGTLG